MGHTVDETWYPNQHMIANAIDAQGKHPYSGQECMVGNGDDLQIATVDKFHIPSTDITCLMFSLFLPLRKFSY